ncbi:MAG: protein kinase, partial [Bryobacterales bacterium]|nr:protein kinase [Bryobacterales bacterium]
GIAQLLDAGRTPSGQPYLVMEYVDGIPIDEYSAPLPLRKKIEVALQVCDAVAHAHRNLVIHRDLKPSNILVDSSGHAKLLDFGIAKILDTATGVTRTRERMMTPEYASPEQVRGGSQTTATDVYLMGAVLYKLLTGSSPHIFSSEEESIDFVICKKEPPPAGLLRPGIPEDLNAILAMALRKEPESRYATMEALMDDLRAFLAYRPVKARSGDLWYRTHKFLRRYWVPVAAAAVAVTGLSAGLLLANHQRNVAQKRFLLVRQMAGRFFALDQELAQLNGSTKVRHSLVATSLEYLTALEKEAKGDPELSLEVAEALLSLSTVQGVPIGPNLGDPAAAEQSLQRAAALVHPILQADPNHREALVLSAVANESRMILAANEKRNAQSEEFATASTRQAETALALGNLSKRQSADAIRILMNASLNRLNSQRLEEGVRLARLAVTHSTQSNQPSQQGHALSLLANGLRLQGELDEALATIRKARKITAEAKYPTTTHRQMNLYGVIWREGMILGKEGGVSLGNRQAAAHAFGEAMDLALQAAAYDRDNTDARIRVASAARELGLVLTPLDPQRALAVLDQGLQSLSEAKPITKVKIETIHLLALSSHPLRQLARAPESRQRI